MKRIVSGAVLTLFTLLLFNCSDKKKTDYTLDMSRINSDTISVGRDSSVVAEFYITSTPGLDCDYITPRVYNSSNMVEERVQTVVVPYPGLPSSARVTISIHADSDCPVGEYSLRCSASNGRVSNTISYILNVR